jgi:hypothetical protein
MEDISNVQSSLAQGFWKTWVEENRTSPPRHQENPSNEKTTLSGLELP